MQDPGLQPERTALAWRRTALAIAVNGGLLVRSALQSGSAVLGLVAGLVLLAALGVFGFGAARRNALLREGTPRAPHGALLLFVLGAVLLACAAALLAQDASVRL